MLFVKNSADNFEEALCRVDFPNYINFENINDTYTIFIQKVMGIIDLVASIKSRRIKQISHECFDSEDAEIYLLSAINYLINFKNQNFTLTKKYIK